MHCMADIDDGGKGVANKLPIVFSDFPRKFNEKNTTGGTLMPQGNGGGPKNTGPGNNENNKQDNTNKRCTPGGRGLGRGGGQGRRDGSGGGQGRGGGGKGGRRSQG